MRFARAALIVALIATASSASASTKRRYFEPDDLELEDPGTLDFDFQVGPMRGDSAGQNRFLLPDFEIGLGLTRQLEFDLDGAFSLNEFDHARRHLAGDPLWVAMKLGLLDVQDEAGGIWAIGVELGPRLPTVDAAGVGYGAVGLFGFAQHGVHLVLNAGAILDPGDRLGSDRPRSIVLGLDLDADLDRKGIWSVQSEFGGTRYFSADPQELAFTLGATYAVTPKLDVSATAFAGFLPNTDRAGLLLGASPQIDLW